METKVEIISRRRETWRPDTLATDSSNAWIGTALLFRKWSKGSYRIHWAGLMSSSFSNIMFERSRQVSCAKAIEIQHIPSPSYLPSPGTCSNVCDVTLSNLPRHGYRLVLVLWLNELLWKTLQQHPKLASSMASHGFH